MTPSLLSSPRSLLSSPRSLLSSPRSLLGGLSLLLLCASLACGGEPFALAEGSADPADAPEQAASEPLAADDEPGLVLLHGCLEPDATCMVAARHPTRATLRCADGVARPWCPVSAVSWPAEAPDTLLALTRSPLRGERLAVRGRWRPGDELQVAEALVRGGEGTLVSRLLWARPSDTPEQATTVAVTPLAGGRGWRDRWVDASAAPGDDLWRNRALVQARSPAGLLLAGRRLGQGTARRLVIDDAFLPFSFAPSLCGEPLRQAIAAASDGLLWPSESDRVIEPLLLPARTTPLATLDTDTLRSWLDLPASASLASRAMQPFVGLGREGGEQDDPERAQAARFRALRALLEAHLTDVQTFAIGEIEVHVVVVGLSRCGELAGISTWSVET